MIIPKNSAPIIINKKDMLIKSNIKKNTECTVFLETVTIIAEKIAIKDVKLRTFITEDNSRNELVNHVYENRF